MRKVLIGIAVVVLLGAGAVAGGYYWVQRTAEREVDAMLAGWRASVGPATRGRVSYDVWTRTAEIRNLLLESKVSPADKVKIARVVAGGIRGPGSVGRLEIADLEVSTALPGLATTEIVQSAPRIVIEDYQGPAAPPPPVQVASGIDVMRLWLEQFAAID